MQKVKILRKFYFENKIYLKNQEVLIEDDFCASPSFYQVLDTFKNPTKRKRKRIKKRTTNITKGDKNVEHH